MIIKFLKVYPLMKYDEIKQSFNNNISIVALKHRYRQFVKPSNMHNLSVAFFIFCVIMLFSKYKYVKLMFVLSVILLIIMTLRKRYIEGKWRNYI